MDAAAAESTGGRPARACRTALEAVLLLALLAFWTFAFAGFGASGYWIDELWTLFVSDPHVGTGEVLRRAMTDVVPPAYYVIVHAWMRLFGDGEAASRSFSALCAVAASAVFVVSTRGAFSRPARLFGAVVGASSLFWFKQSQNLRGYALAVLILAALLGCALAARRRSRAGEPVGSGLCLALAGLGLLGAFVHYYLFLAVGLLYLALLVGVPDRRLRATVLVSGAVILLAVLAYRHVAQSHLLFTQLWFSNDADALSAAFANTWEMALGPWAKFAVLMLAAVALYGLAVRRPALSLAAAPGDWIAATGLFVGVGLTASGLAVSFLITPSFSARNLMIAAPCSWILVAWLYDRAQASGPRLGLAAAALATLLLCLELPVLKGRLLNRTQDWRGSADYVAAQAGCAGRDIPVVVPALFGPDTPFFRRLAEGRLFGWYYRGHGRLVAHTLEELATSRDPQLTGLLAARAGGADPCPVLAWGVHDVSDAQANALAQALAQRPEVNGPVRVRRFPSYRAVDGLGERWRLGSPSAYVFEAARPGASS